MTLRHFIQIIAIGLACCQAAKANAQGIRGLISGDDGAIPYASVRAEGNGTGTMANPEGRYELKLPPGRHTVLFQSLGYKVERRSVEVSAQAWADLDIRLQTQAIQLKEANVGTREDPAYSIMRRAIAKAPIHRMQVLGYQAKAYIRGGGQLKEVPWLIRGKVKEAGIDPNTVFFIENVSEITYRAPNFYKNRAISIRSNMQALGNNLPNPAGYVSQSFYEAKVGSAVSPLSPRAFSYYRFSYEGIFEDRGVEVNKIRVQPRQRGDDVFDGYIYVIEGDWSLHSLQLTTRHEGITATYNHLYSPMQGVWMPATQKYLITGKVYGFRFEFTYVASLRDYKLQVNPALVKPIEVIDEKAAPAEARALRKAERRKSDQALAQTLADTNGRMTRKTMRKLARNLRRQERAEARAANNGHDVVAQDSTVIDSNAYKRDSTYWASARPIPLTAQEVRSTRKLDSLGVEIKKEMAKDSAKAKKSTRGFDISWITWGRTFYTYRRTGDTLPGGKPKRERTPHQIIYRGLVDQQVGFNPVEGFVEATGIGYAYNKKGSPRSFYIGPNVRYQNGPKRLLVNGEAHYSHKAGYIRAEGGQGISQLNPEGAIGYGLNTMAATLFERSYIRLFAKDYARLETEAFFADKFLVQGGVEWAQRSYLQNTTSRTLINWRDRTFDGNVEANYYAGTTLFAQHRAAIADAKLTFTPTVRYQVINGRRSFVGGTEPYFHLMARAGVPRLGGSTTDFLATAIGIEQRVNLGIRATLLYYLEGGAFLYNRQSFVPDYFHFPGNETFLIVGDGLRSFRTLPYYFYSNPVRYGRAHVVYTPRMLTLTRLLPIQMLGWRETLGFHSLWVPGRAPFSELTYGIDGIFRFARAEAVAVFDGGRFSRMAFRIGLTLKGYSGSLRRKPVPSPAEKRSRSININLG